jgi:hypothetical protein
MGDHEQLVNWMSDQPIGYIATTDLGEEACGIFFHPDARLDGAGRATPIKFIPLENTWHNKAERKIRFEFEAISMAEAIINAYEMRQPAGRVQIFHSHLSANPPTDDDRAMARFMETYGQISSYWRFHPTHLLWTARDDTWHEYNSNG